MIYKFGNWYEQGKRIYPNAKQLKDLQATLEVTEVQSPSQVQESVSEAVTEAQKSVPTKRTYTKKVKTE